MRRDIVVIGASAGGLEALGQIVPLLPADLEASIFVVVHIPELVRSALPMILSRWGPLPAAHPVDQERIQRRRIYVAPPGRHMLVDDGQIRLTHGPRENSHRPAIDPLFRSAARAYGPRVVACVLSGSLDDGAVGAMVVKQCGGLVVTQSLKDALHKTMPRSVLEGVGADYTVSAVEMAALLVRLVREDSAAAAPKPSAQVELETKIEHLDPEAIGQPIGVPSGLSCPECNGALYEVQNGSLIRYRCMVGHAYGLDTLGMEKGRAVEDALWMALRVLKESAALARRMRDRNKARRPLIAERYHRDAEAADHNAETLRRLIESWNPTGPETATKENEAD